MDIALSELMERTQGGLRSLELDPKTIALYQITWKALADYFQEHDQVLFSRPLAEQYLREAKANVEAGGVKRWRYEFDRRVVHRLLECFETGQVIGKPYREQPVHLRQTAYLRLQADYLNHLQTEGKGAGTLQSYGRVARQFLEYLEQQDIQAITQVGRNEISAFLPFVSKHYRPASMATVLTALRSFLWYLEARELIPVRLSPVLPARGGRTTRVVPALTPEEEQHLLAAAAAARATASGKRNYAMLLLALRLGLRSSDIINLKLEDIRWRSNTLELVQAKTGARLVLPLLTEAGNAIADYLLHARPPSPLPYVFLRSQAPYRQLAGHSTCYQISRRLMAKAAIRQGPGERKGFHCLRHTVAARLLAGGTLLPIISSLLGHQDKNSTQVYLSTDLDG